MLRNNISAHVGKGRESLLTTHLNDREQAINFKSTLRFIRRLENKH